MTGKGGVGKTSVAGALGLLAARRGRRTVVAEVAGQARLRRAFGVSHEADPLYEHRLADGLYTVSIEPETAMEEYLSDQLPDVLAEVLTSSRAFTYLTAATPGMRELLTIGKAWELAQPERRTPGADPYDLVIIDAPATGHGLAFLRAPRSFAEIARVGRVARQARQIDELISDAERTGVVVVALPAEAAVAEALLLQEELGPALDRIVVNELEVARVGPRQAVRVGEALSAAPSAAAEAALRVALASRRRADHEREQVRRLTEASGVPPAELPRLVAERWDAAALDRLSRHLEESL